MVLSGNTIRKLGIFTPFCERSIHNGMSYGLSYAGYDIRIDTGPYDAELVGPGEFFLGASLEHFHMPSDVIGFVHDKSSWARRGLAVQNTVIEPGWRGHLTIELTNHGVEEIWLDNGDPIAQIVFHRLDEHVKGYEGKYQDQERGPQEVRYESE